MHPTTPIAPRVSSHHIPPHPTSSRFPITGGSQQRREADIATGAVGLIRTPELADEIVANGRADLVFMGRALLADPGWPLRAATALGVKPHLVPQYQRAVV